jgi:hypothetical protein
MRSVFIAGMLLAGVTWAAPSASAQDPTPPPQPRERAVRRAEPARQQPAETRQGSGEGSSRAIRRETPPPRSEPARPRDEARPRSTPAEEPTRTRVAPPSDGANADADDQGARRRGGVRRPSGESGSPGGAIGDRAVPRTEARTPRQPDRVFIYPDYYRYYNRYYDPWGYGGYGLGYFYYSPWAWDPGYYSGYGYGYGQPRYSAYGYDLGSLKIKVKPRDAEVFVDGYYAGTVDDFDGIFQSLKLAQGGYRIEVRKPGYETLHFDVRVQPDRTITFRGDLKPVP